jgi:hypothetical protein
MATNLVSQIVVENAVQPGQQIARASAAELVDRLPGLDQRVLNDIGAVDSLPNGPAKPTLCATFQGGTNMSDQ